MKTQWQTELENEFLRAEMSRASGNEGQARVCARRAAGIAIQEYFRRIGKTPISQSAYELLQWVSGNEDLSPSMRSAAKYLTLRVNEDFELPVDVDLVAEARRLCNEMLPDLRI